MKWIVILILLIFFLPQLAAAELEIGMDIPLKNKEIYQENRLVAGVSWYERGQVVLTNTGDENLHNILVSVDVPLQMDIEIPVQAMKNISADNNIVTARIGELGPGESISFIFSVKPPESIEFKKKGSFAISASYEDSAGTHSTSYTHVVEVVPPPSWITYGTVLASICIILLAFLIAWKFNVLEQFTTIDLVTIALLAGLIGVVFRWFWQTFNDLLGPLGGLLFTIPTAVLMIIALQIVRKPGTATLLFTVVELVALVVWGSNITVWMGWYMTEGIIVDILVLLFRKDYADRRSTAIIYAVARSAYAYWMFYFFFAPAVWKVYYAPWYAWGEVGIAAIGGLIGGAIGYSIAKKVRGAMM